MNPKSGIKQRPVKADLAVDAGRLMGRLLHGATVKAGGSFSNVVVHKAVKGLYQGEPLIAIKVGLLLLAGGKIGKLAADINYIAGYAGQKARVVAHAIWIIVAQILFFQECRASSWWLMYSP
jgi:hypothetical protein